MKTIMVNMKLYNYKQTHFEFHFNLSIFKNKVESPKNQNVFFTGKVFVALFTCSYTKNYFQSHLFFSIYGFSKFDLKLNTIHIRRHQSNSRIIDFSPTPLLFLQASGFQRHLMSLFDFIFNIWHIFEYNLSSPFDPSIFLRVLSPLAMVNLLGFPRSVSCLSIWSFLTCLKNTSVMHLHFWRSHAHQANFLDW